MPRCVIVGGTFDCLHAGHRLLLASALKCAKGGVLLVGLTSDSFAKKARGYKVGVFEERQARVLAFLGKLGATKTRISVAKINSRFGMAVSSKAATHICVSEETISGALEINRKRKKLGMKALVVCKVPIILGSDCLKISSSRVHAGQISESGKRLTRIRGAIGSQNPAKLAGAKNAARKLFGKNVLLVPCNASSGIPSQPFGSVTIRGAKNRALAAFKKTKCDFGVGFESGLFEFGGKTFDIVWCAIFSPDFGFSLGSSEGFDISDEVAAKIKSEKSSLGDVVSKIAGIKNIGKGFGAIHYLSGGLLKRQDMVEQSFLCAMIPRISKKIEGDKLLRELKAGKAWENRKSKNYWKNQPGPVAIKLKKK